MGAEGLTQRTAKHGVLFVPVPHRPWKIRGVNFPASSVATRWDTAAHDASWCHDAWLRIESAVLVAHLGDWHTMPPMSKQLEAVYENGVLRPLQPLALADQQHVLVTVDEILDYKAWATAQLRELGPAPGLAEIQRQLSAIPGSMSEVIVEERGER